MISPQGQARRFASLPPGRFLSGIAFDSTGRFGHRLLVTAGYRGWTTVFGVGCDGRLSAVAAGAPAGGDIGVESVPPRAAAAYLADRFSAANRHPGDNAIVRLSAADLAQAGIRAGDLLVATEGGARTIDVRSARLAGDQRDVVPGAVAVTAVAPAGGHHLRPPLRLLLTPRGAPAGP